MGSVTSKQDKCIADLPDDERYFGLENFGNTCYANSVLQILFFCKPFRREVLAWAAARAATGAEPEPESLLSCLADLFVQISTQKKKTGSVSPRRLMHRIKADNALFSGSMHQDAHEFFNYLLNQVHETLLAQARRAQEEGTRGRGNDCREARAFVHPSPLGPARSGNSAPSAGPSSRGGSPPPASTSGRHRRSDSLQALAQAAAEAQAAKEASAPQTWVQSLFQGRLVSETQCLRCESVTSREESMFDLSLDIAPNSSLSACLRAFAATEMLQGGDKFFCDHCGSLQEAYRRMRILQAPPVLCLHLKRFKYVESAGRLRKLAYRVVFPFSLTLPRAGALEGEAGGRENGGESGSGREARTSREDRTYREDRINREEAGGQARLRKETASAFAAAALPPQPPRLKAQTPKAAPGSYPISCATSAEPQSADALFALRADSTASSPLSCGPSLPGQERGSSDASPLSAQTSSPASPPAVSPVARRPSAAGGRRPDVAYELVGVVVHMGAHPSHGHYVSLIKSQGQWLCFDDDQVVAVRPNQVRSTFGLPSEGAGAGAGGLDHGYILVYQQVGGGTEAAICAPAPASGGAARQGSAKAAATPSSPGGRQVCKDRSLVHYAERPEVHANGMTV